MKHRTPGWRPATRICLGAMVAVLAVSCSSGATGSGSGSGQSGGGNSGLSPDKVIQISSYGIDHLSVSSIGNRLFASFREESSFAVADTSTGQVTPGENYGLATSDAVLVNQKSGQAYLYNRYNANSDGIVLSIVDAKTMTTRVAPAIAERTSIAGVNSNSGDLYAIGTYYDSTSQEYSSLSQFGADLSAKATNVNPVLVDGAYVGGYDALSVNSTSGDVAYTFGTHKVGVSDAGLRTRWSASIPGPVDNLVFDEKSNVLYALLSNRLLAFDATSGSSKGQIQIPGGDQTVGKIAYDATSGRLIATLSGSTDVIGVSGSTPKATKIGTMKLPDFIQSVLQRPGNNFNASSVAVDGASRTLYVAVDGTVLSYRMS